MKKYSDDWFESKYRIISDKLLQKQGFFEEIKIIRKELGLPIVGFDSESKLASFLVQKMNKSEQGRMNFFIFADSYVRKNQTQIIDEDKEKIVLAFLKENKNKNINLIPLILDLSKNINSHHNLFTKHPYFGDNKYLSRLYPSVMKIMQKYWGVDLLDDHIIIHLIEKYLFLGQGGINQYIKSRLSCHNCRYIGIENFSPDRNSMQGKDKGPYSKNYIFNRETVKILSNYFHSVFVIIKPYATKEMAIQYIEDNWDSIKTQLNEKNTFYKQYDVTPSITRTGDDEKNRLVYDLYKLSKKDLLKTYTGKREFNYKGIYKESIISAILEETYNIKMTPEAIKKSANRFSKSIQVKQKPKDIRDI